jgi:hypothetical protein
MEGYTIRMLIGVYYIIACSKCSQGSNHKHLNGRVGKNRRVPAITDLDLDHSVSMKQLWEDYDFLVAAWSVSILR